MNAFLLIIFVAAISITGVNSQENMDSILSDYLKVKDALVQSDAQKASLYAADLQKTIHSSTSFKEKDDLLAAVGTIVKETDLEKQRVAFAALSALMWKIVKNTGQIGRDVYYQYCPMKKSYWLSGEQTIKNPYYGSKMLTCGSTSDKKIQ